jgi:uncharacterized protein
VIDMMRALTLGLLSAYRAVVSPLLPRACRFYPSCSVYTEEAIRKHGILKGVAFGCGRLGRCHPWHPGGYDPVK